MKDNTKQTKDARRLLAARRLNVVAAQQRARVALADDSRLGRDYCDGLCLCRALVCRRPPGWQCQRRGRGHWCGDRKDGKREDSDVLGE